MNNNMGNDIIPFMIEKNMGQHKNESKFVLKNNKGSVFFLQSEIIFELMKIKEGETEEHEHINKQVCQLNFIHMKLKNSNKESELQGVGEFDCKINYFKGKD